MFVADMSGAAAGRAPEPDGREALLIWCVRRLALDGGLRRAAAVEAALAREFGGAGQELSVLLRCLVHALALHCPRRLVLGHACRPEMTADERRLLAGLRGGAVAGLGPEAVLGPLFGAISGLRQLGAPCLRQ